MHVGHLRSRGQVPLEYVSWAQVKEALRALYVMVFVCMRVILERVKPPIRNRAWCSISASTLVLPVNLRSPRSSACTMPPCVEVFSDTIDELLVCREPAQATEFSWSVAAHPRSQDTSITLLNAHCQMPFCCCSHLPASTD